MKSEFPGHNRFSFDTLVTEVDTIVEDLRWLHFELKLRNQFNEILFRETDSIDEFLRLTFEGVRARLAALDLTIYLKDAHGYSIGFKELEASVFWGDEAVPWTESVESVFASGSRYREAPQPVVNHYQVEGDPLTVVTMPVVVNREAIAAIVLVAHSSNVIPRLRKLLNGVSGSLSVSFNYIANLRASSAKHASSRALSLADVVRMLDETTAIAPMISLAVDEQGSVIHSNYRARSILSANIGLQNDERFGGSERLNSVRLPEFLRRTEQNVSMGGGVHSITDTDGVRFTFRWYGNRIGSDSGTITHYVGIPAEENGNLVTRAAPLYSAETSAIHENLSLLRRLREAYAILLDEEFRIVALNEELESELGLSEETYALKPLVETFVPQAERRGVGRKLEEIASRTASASRARFHLEASGGATVTASWQFTRIGDEAGGLLFFLLIGSRLFEREEGAASHSEEERDIYSLHPRLSKQYRFLMKYVPFPIVHLNESGEIIKNANPAFEAIIGTKSWENQPLSDFGTMQTGPGLGDPLPCTLYVLNQDGITITYRGILSTLALYGKIVKEVKLDPIE